MEKLDIRAKLFAAKVAEKEIDIPVIGKVRIREMTGSQRDEIENWSVQNQRTDKAGKPILDVRGIRAMTVICSVVDDNGMFVFNRGDMEKISEAPTQITDAIVEAAQELNGITRRVRAALGEGSGEEVIDGSGSSSPSDSELEPSLNSKLA